MNNKTVKLDWKNLEDKNSLDENIKKLKNNEIDSIEIKNILSCEIEDMFGLEITDFNGWQCDWWSSSEGLDFSGCAWYGTVEISKS